jgi:hypothetical protein
MVYTEVISSCTLYPKHTKCPEGKMQSSKVDHIYISYRSLSHLANIMSHSATILLCVQETGWLGNINTREATGSDKHVRDLHWGTEAGQDHYPLAHRYLPPSWVPHHCSEMSSSPWGHWLPAPLPDLHTSVYLESAHTNSCLDLSLLSATAQIVIILFHDDSFWRLT